MRTALLTLIAIVPTLATAQTRYLDVVNTSSYSIASFATAAAGSDDFRAVVLADRPVRGGGESATVALEQSDGGCLRDLRTTFTDGRVLIQKDFDVCKARRYHTGRLGRAAPEPARLATLP